MTRGLTQTNLFSGEFYAVPAAHIESVDRHAAHGPRRPSELWKLNHYYERLDELDAAHGLPPNPFAPPAPSRSRSCTT